MSDAAHSPTPWILNDMADLKAADGGLVTSLGWDISPANEKFLLRAVNAHESLVKVMKAIEFAGHQGKCPICWGWMAGPNGETPGMHTKDCELAATLRLAEGS